MHLRPLALVLHPFIFQLSSVGSQFKTLHTIYNTNTIPDFFVFVLQLGFTPNRDFPIYCLFYMSQAYLGSPGSRQAFLQSYSPTSGCSLLSETAVLAASSLSSWRRQKDHKRLIHSLSLVRILFCGVWPPPLQTHFSRLGCSVWSCYKGGMSQCIYSCSQFYDFLPPPCFQLLLLFIFQFLKLCFYVI